MYWKHPWETDSTIIRECLQRFSSEKYSGMNIESILSMAHILWTTWPLTSSSGLETCTQKTFQGHESLLFQLLCFAPSDYVLHTAAVNVWLIYHQQGSGLETCTRISFAPKTIHAYIFVLLLCATHCGEGLARLSWGEHRREAWAQKLSTSTQTRPKNKLQQK